MAVQFSSLAGLRVEVDRVQYDPSLGAPKDRPFPFAYHLSIHNDSEETVTLFGRKWVVADSTTGQTLVVEGDGIVGQFPRLTPGKVFSYNSYHVILNESRVTGAFFGTTDKGTPVRVTIPDFLMSPPMLA